MEATPSQSAVKWLPSLTDLAFLMPIGFLFGRMDGVQTLLGDGDTGWHIRTGQWIVANRTVPTHDMFSFSKPGGVWVAWEWLSDVVFAWLNNMGGLRMVILLAVLLLCVTFTLLFRLMLRRSNPVIAIAVATLAVPASSVHWLARPHLFTLLFLVLFYAALWRVREGRGRLGRVPILAILPAATVLWTNLHAGFLIGIALITVFGAGELLTAGLSADGAVRRAAALRSRSYILCALASLAASLVNPYTYRLHVHLWQYLRDPYASQHIMEFFSLSFHHPLAMFFETLVLLSAAAAFWYASQGRYTEALLLLSFAHIGLLAARNVPLFAIVAAPLVAGALQSWLTRLPQGDVAPWLRSVAVRYNQLAEKTAGTDALPRWHVVSVAGVALVAALLFAPAPPKRFRSEYDPKSYPAAAIEVLRRNPGARVFTSDVWGGYLIWRLYPAGRVFLDGRSDYYGSDFEEKYSDVINVKSDWQKTLDHFGVDMILLPPGAPLSGALKETSRWQVVYDDGVALVFRSLTKSPGNSISAASPGRGAGRDREVTKTQACDQAITDSL